MRSAEPYAVYPDLFLYYWKLFLCTLYLICVKGNDRLNIWAVLCFHGSIRLATFLQAIFIHLADPLKRDETENESTFFCLRRISGKQVKKVFVTDFIAIGTQNFTQNNTG